MREILKLIKQKQSFLITSHHNPDADALASSLAVALWLKGQGKKVAVLNEDACPSWLSFLPQSKLLRKAKDVKKVDAEVALVLDCGDLSRVGGVAKLISQDMVIVNIDHHVTNDRFGKFNWVDTKASSTCEMVYDLLKAAKASLSKGMATLLYAGIMTDTGSFRYDNTSPKTHAIAAELMGYGIDAAAMYKKLYVGMPVADMKGFAQTIASAQLHFKNKVFCVSLTAAQAEAFSKDFDLKEKLFTFLRSVEGVDVVVILTQLKSKEIRVNLRSQQKVNVALIANKYDGGGHPKAAGCKIYDTLANAEKIILKDIGKEI